jgi:hypothetical protein
MKPLSVTSYSAVAVAFLAVLSCAAQDPLAESTTPDMSRQHFQRAISSVLLSLTPAALASGEDGDTWLLAAREAMRLSRKDVRAAARDLGNASYSLELKDADNGFLVQRRAARQALTAAGLEHHRTFFNASGFITNSVYLTPRQR